MAERGRRLALGIGGQALWRALTAAYSVVVIPFMIRAWGLPLYGEWLTLTALATYISASNYGLTAASAMQMIASAARGDVAHVLGVFRASLFALLFLIALACAAMTLLALHFDLRSTFHVSRIDPASLRTIMIALFVQVCAITVRGLLLAVSNSTGSYGGPYTLSSVWRGVEIGGTLAGLAFFHASPVTIAVLVATTTVLDMLTQGLLARRLAPWVRFRPRLAELALLRPLIMPSLGHTTINVAVNAISINGMRLAIGAALGSVAVAVFSVTTTLTRLSEHIINLVLPIVQLEFARSNVEDSREALSLIELSSGFGVLAHAGVASALLLFGAPLFLAWTSHQATLDEGLLVLLLIATFATQLGRPLQAFLMGRNLTGVAAVLAIICSLVTIGIAIAGFGSAGLRASGVALIVGESAAWLGMLWLVGRVLSVSPVSLARHQFTVIRPIRLALALLNRFALQRA